MATREAPRRTGTTIDVDNPATGEVVGTVPALDEEDVDQLVARGRDAQPGWDALGFEGRGEVLTRARRWLGENAERVIETIVSETGKSWDDAQYSELIYGVSALGFWARTAPEYLADEEVETANPFVRGRRMVVRYAPVGVVGVIGPWNYPLTNSFGDCIPALGAGNSVVLKPSEETPLTSLLMAEMLADSGLPEGVFQVATGRGATGAALVDAVDYVHFTGSVETGKKVMERAARTLTPVGLELGGKDPMIVLADADLERAANAAVAYGMGNAGQTCISVERVYVEDEVHDEFVRLVTERAGALRVGASQGPGSVDVGAITFPPQLDLIEEHVADAVDNGARVATGGRRGEGPGRFYEPTVLVDVDHSMLCMREETFGPTLPVMRVRDADEAVALANEGPYGLQASVWTRDVERGEELARRVEAGACCVNDAQVNYAALELPMGGWKESGLGSRHGADGIRKYTARQTILVTPPTAPPRETHYFPFSAEAVLQVVEAVRFMATSELLTDAQRRTLTTLCDTFVPSIEVDDDPHGFWARAASHLAVPEAIEQALAQLPAKQVEGLGELLDALAAQGLNEAPPDAREAVVHGFADSGPEGLAGIHALKGLTMTLHYALPDLGTGRNPNWAAIGYPGPVSAPREVPKELRVRVPEAEAITIDADVCVVGSGAGGGVVAGELAVAGKQVCVLEMGGYFNEADFNQLELPAYQRMYLNGGPFPTAEGQITIQAGSTLGGGTVINWTNSLRTHAWVREQWAREHGLEGVDGAEFDRHLDAVLERVCATDECSDRNGNHERLADGCEALGYELGPTVRNTDRDSYDPGTAGFIGFGDASGSKRSTAKTYLADAQQRGADLMAHCRAQRILVEDGRAAGVEAAYADPEGRTAQVTVRAPHVVVACGSIESPSLLLRSGIGGPAVGDYLRLHPTTAVSGHYEDDQRPWWGPPQAAISHQFADLEDGYGFLLECPHHTTGLAAAAGAWESGAKHKEFMLEWSRTASFINLTRDRGHGRVGIDETGNAVVEYPLADELDVRNFRRGLDEMVRLHEAAGARRIVALARRPTYWERGRDVDAFADEVGRLSLAPREHAIFSAHQMGSCRMGVDPETSVAGPWGELHDVKGVWIGDASAFPTASGVNPMITIMALAHRTAKAIAAA
ncbi:MAG TPA: aldehyde dehydrogenase family protein [Solirubrobacterales bacterium]|nr:aldehyde dehydrogenase family protein [Solirubrobacterales bacterium]